MKQKTKNLLVNAGWGALLPSGLAAFNYSTAAGLGIVSASAGKLIYVAVREDWDKVGGWICGVIGVSAGAGTITAGIFYPKETAAVVAGLGVAMAVPAYKKAKEWIAARTLSRSNDG